MSTLAEVQTHLHTWFPPETADSWDAVGLVAGDPAAQVRKVLFAVDPSPQVAAEAAEWGADLLVVHHPLFLTAVHGMAATTAKGRTLATLTRAGCALLTAHTNADQAAGGVSEALATALGVAQLAPLRPAPGPAQDKLTVFVPADAASVVRAALAEAGAGRLGHYDQASFSSSGEGRFRPLPGSDPMIGSIGTPEVVDEVRIEVVLDRARRGEVVAAMTRQHPYDHPAYDVVEMVDVPGSTGTGRIGVVEPTTLGDFARTVADALPETSHGVRVAGDPERPVRRVAVCGGAGDFLLDQLVTSEADVFLTSDLRHHPASEFLEKQGPALIDVSHWAAESMWLPVVAERLAGVLGSAEHAAGSPLETRVSTVNTDPWTMRL